MSGVEALTALQIVPSIVSIIHGLQQTYKAAKQSQGLHAAFQKVYENTSLVLEILAKIEDVEKSQETPNRTMIRPAEPGSSGVKPNIVPILSRCETDAKELQDIFQKVIPEADAKWLERYRKALQSTGPSKRRRVEELMRDILVKLQLLHEYTFYENTIRMDKLSAAIEDLGSLPNSLSDEDSRYIHSGSGAQHNNASTGTQYINSQYGGSNNKMFNAHTMSFGSGQI